MEIKGVINWDGTNKGAEALGLVLKKGSKTYQAFDLETGHFEDVEQGNPIIAMNNLHGVLVKNRLPYHYNEKDVGLLIK